jgi:hypothetical protein
MVATSLLDLTIEEPKHVIAAKASTAGKWGLGGALWRGHNVFLIGFGCVYEYHYARNIHGEFPTAILKQTGKSPISASNVLMQMMYKE